MAGEGIAYQIPMAAKFQAPDIPAAMSAGMDLKQKQIETQDATAQQNDRQTLQEYGGDLYTPEGIEQAKKDLKGKVSFRTYDQLGAQGQKLKDHDLDMRLKISQMGATDVATFVGKGNAVLGGFVPTVENYNVDVKSVGEQEARTRFEANRNQVLAQLGNAKDSQGKPLFSPDELAGFAQMDPKHLEAAVRVSKPYHDMATAKLQEAQAKYYGSGVTLRDTQAKRAGEGPDKLHIREIQARVAQGDITEEEGDILIKTMIDKGRADVNLAEARAGKVFADTTLAKQIAQGGAGGMMSPEDSTFAARQYIQGDKTVINGLGTGRIGAANRAAVRRAIRVEAEEQGLTPEQVTQHIAEFAGTVSGERALGTRTAQLEMASAAADGAADLVLKYSDQVPRSEVQDLNKLLLMVDAKTGDPKVIKLAGAVNSLINMYARAINPSGVASVSDKDHAREIIAPYFAQGQIDAAVEVIQNELALERKAPGTVKKQMRELAGSERARPAAATSPPGSKIPPATQTARESDAVRILGDELADERQKLADLKLDKLTDPKKIELKESNLKSLEREYEVAQRKAGVKPAAAASVPAATASAPATKKLTYDPATGTFK